MKDRVVILGDSLSLPRPDDNIDYEDTYPYLLAKEGYEVLNRSRRANDTKIQTKQENLDNDIHYLEPDMVVLHLGIVDCAPRLFYRLENKIISQINKVIPIINFLSKYRYTLTRVFPKKYVSVKKFKKNIHQILDILQKKNIKVLVIGIADTTEHNKSISYGFEHSILAYNQILKEATYQCSMVEYMDIYGLGAEVLLPDGIHLNKEMHKTLAKKLSVWIEKNR